MRGLVMGGLGAVAAAGFHSALDFGLHMPANALLLVAVLALLPAVVTLRSHRAGLQVDLREWRRDLGLRPRVVMGVVTAVVGPDDRVDPRALRGRRLEVPGSQPAGQREAARPRSRDGDRSRRGPRASCRRAARLDPRNPRIQAEWAAVTAELGHRVWTFALAPDGSRLRPGTVRDRLVTSQPFLGAAYAAYGRSLRSQPRVALGHERFGLFLNRLDAVRRTVEAERLRDAVAPELADTLGSDESLLPRALQHLQEAVHLDPASPARHLSAGGVRAGSPRGDSGGAGDRGPGVPGGDPPRSRLFCRPSPGSSRRRESRSTSCGTRCPETR